MSLRPTARRATSAASVVWGCALLVAPTELARAVAGPGALPPEGVVRVLGVRRVIQGLGVGATSSPAVAWLSVGVDALHAGTMVAAARMWPQYRKAELTSAAIALSSALVTTWVARDGAPRR